MPEESKESNLASKYKDATKFTAEEIEQIKDVQKKYVGIQQAFGSLEVNKLRLQQQLEANIKATDQLRDKFIELQNSEQDLITKLNEKYDDGTLNPETGDFVPTKDKS